jgi:hypothetical protein
MEATTTTHTTLTHNQEIRVKGFGPYCTRIHVWTARGLNTEGMGKEMTPDEFHAECIKRGEGTAWAAKESACITSDYPGKREKLEAQRAATAAAIEIEDGQTVEIEGELFKVKVMGERYSDPVHFIKI